MAKPIYPHLSHPIAAFRQPATSSLDTVADLMPPPAVLRAQQKAFCETGEMAIYLAGSQALSVIAKALGVIILKVGVSAGNPIGRIARLNRTGYAGFWGREGSLSRLPGGDSWDIWRMRNVSSELASGMRYARLTSYGDVKLTVPRTVQRETVDKAIAYVLQARSLRRFLASDEGRIRCMQVSIDPKSWFYTYYDEKGRYCPVEELIIIDPAQESGALLMTLEALGAHLSAGNA